MRPLLTRDEIIRRLAEIPPIEDLLTADDLEKQRAAASAATLTPAAVLLLVVNHPGEPTVVFTQRTAHLADHAGQISFPGGRVEEGDEGPAQTALREAREEVGYEESGKKDGAKLVAGGGIPKSQPKGYFVEPTIFAAVPNHIRIAQEEIFGPVVSVIPFADEDDAIRIANDSSYGLGGAIYSKDTAKAVAMAKRIRTGVVWINNGLNQMDGPFGGFKESGIGREGGKWGLEEYTEVQQITWRT